MAVTTVAIKLFHNFYFYAGAGIIDNVGENLAHRKIHRVPSPRVSYKAPPFPVVDATKLGLSIPRRFTSPRPGSRGL